MIIIDFIFASYYIITRKAPENQVRGTSLLVSVIPLTWYSASIIFLITRWLFPEHNFFGIVTIVMLLLIIFFTWDKFLVFYYTKNKAKVVKIDLICERLKRLRYIALLIWLFYLISSIVFFAGTMKYALIL